MYLTPRKLGPDELSIESLNWRAMDHLPRDCDQSHRLHEPNLMISSVDPMTGEEISDLWAPLKIQSSKQDEARAKNVTAAYR